jgi:secretion/DNA translocation related TadE-like protein
VALTAVLTFVTLAAAAGGRVVVEQRRAAAAADLAALSGATAVQQGRAGCATAARTATSNGARLAGCRLEGDDIDLTVAIPVQVVGRSFEVAARAHAGPVTGPAS